MSGYWWLSFPMAFPLGALAGGLLILILDARDDAADDRETKK